MQSNANTSSTTELVDTVRELRRTQRDLAARSQAHALEIEARQQLESALRRTLEAVSRAAFLVSPTAVVSANSQGAAALDREGDSLRTRLRDVVRTLASNDGYDVTPAGPSGQFVVVRHGASDDIAGRFGRAAARWSLSPRQLDVLRGLVDGQPNTKIAERLGCNSRTVETHVAALLQRADSGSRLELVASFWWDV